MAFTYDDAMKELSKYTEDDYVGGAGDEPGVIDYLGFALSKNYKIPVDEALDVLDAKLYNAGKKDMFFKEFPKDMESSDYYKKILNIANTLKKEEGDKKRLNKLVESVLSEPVSEKEFNNIRSMYGTSED